MIVAIPSKGRPTGVKSLKVIPSAAVYVPQVEAEDYRRAGVRNLVAVPDSVKGITATRNWILGRAVESGDPRVVMIDDDVQKVGWVRLHPHRAQTVSIGEGVLLAEFERLFDVTEQAGFRVWGVDTIGATRSVYPWKPILWRTYLTASCCGVLADRIRFDESFPVKEDYEIGLRAIKEDGGIVGARFFFWRNSHWTDAGGCAAYRTQLMELRAIKRLMAMYPGLIRRVRRGGSGYSIEIDF